MKSHFKHKHVSSACDEAYDLSISNEVSLSEVLDELLRAYEKPDVIIHFLKMHDNDFESIYAHSLNCSRIFMLDFVLRCSDDSIDYIMQKLMDIDILIAMTCCWQVLSAHTNVSSYVKAAFRQVCTSLQKFAAFRHPYSHLCVNEVKDIDMLFFDVVMKGGRAHEIAAYVNSIDIIAWEHFTQCMHASLFFFRLVQADIIEALDEDHLRALLMHADIFDRHIMMQWLNADVSIAHKEFICKRLCFTRKTFGEIISAKWSDVEKSFNKSLYVRYYSEDDPVMADSFEEMMLKITLNGRILARDVAYDLLRIGRISFLVEWMKFNADELDDALKISDVMKIADAEMKAEKLHRRACKKMQKDT